MTENSKPEPIPEFITNPKGHEWRKNENGNVDVMAYSFGDCNGPVCVKCDFSFCQHCTGDKVTEECPKK